MASWASAGTELRIDFLEEGRVDPDRAPFGHRSAAVPSLAEMWALIFLRALSQHRSGVGIRQGDANRVLV